MRIDNVAVELNRANALLSKVRHCVDKKLWNQSILQFLNHTYSIPVLFVHRILIPLKDFVFYKINRIYLLNRNAHTAPLFKDSNILKFPDKIALEICFFIKN